MPPSSRRRSTQVYRSRHPATSDPCPPAFIRTAPPTEPGTPDGPRQAGPSGLGRLPGEDREAAWPPRPGPRTGARPGRRIGQRDRVEPLAEAHDHAVEAARRRRAGSSPARSRTPATVRFPIRARSGPQRGRRARRPPQELRGPTHAVRGQCPEGSWRVARPPSATANAS